MPAEQRVISIGLITLGLAVVGILYWLFGRSDPVLETRDRLQNDLYPQYQAAEKDRDYSDWRKVAQEMLDAMDSGGRQVAEKSLEVEATGRNRDAQRLHKLVKDKVIDRIAGNEFPYEDAFYPESVHRALTDMEAVVGGQFKTLAKARRLSEKMNEALDMIRGGSGLPIPAPPAIELSGETNPLLLHDATAFAVLNIDPALVVGALKTKNPGGRANSLRIRWNNENRGPKLAKELTEFKPLLADLQQVAARFRAAFNGIKDHPAAPAAAKKIYGDACDKLASELPAAVRKSFDDSRATYENGDEIVRMLLAESKILSAGEARWDALGKALQLKFP